MQCKTGYFTVRFSPYVSETSYQSSHECRKVLRFHLDLQQCEFITVFTKTCWIHSGLVKRFYDPLCQKNLQRYDFPL